jgi:hypothetical protein
MELIDKECLNLCLAMNRLPGIFTFESCCGHGKSPFHIWFYVDGLPQRGGAGLLTLSRLTCPRYYNYAKDELRLDPVWTIRVDHNDTSPKVCYLLEGHPMLLDKAAWDIRWDGWSKWGFDSGLYPPAERLAQTIIRHIDDCFATYNILTNYKPSDTEISQQQRKEITDFIKAIS